MSRHRVTLIPGDGIGPEVIEAAHRALEATGVRFDWDVQQVGAQAMEKLGTPLPDSVIASVKSNGIALKGPVSTPSRRWSTQRRSVPNQQCIPDRTTDLSDQRWIRAPCNPALETSEVHVWRAILGDVRGAEVWLAPDELQRAARFHFERDRAHFIAARGFLRSVLGSYLNAAPERLRFSYGAHGKPALDGKITDSNLRFNLSHSAGIALIAIARGREVGVDVECIKQSIAGPEIAERFFSSAEVHALRRLPQAQQQGAFFAGWTRKEAYIKAIGAGLFAALDRFTVSLSPHEPAALLTIEDDPDQAAHWQLFELYPGEGYAGALAIEGTASQLRCWQWTPRNAT